MNNLIQDIQKEFARDFTTTGLKVAIAVWAIIVVVSAFSINNKWILAGILAYEVLP